METKTKNTAHLADDQENGSNRADDAGCNVAVVGNSNSDGAREHADNANERHHAGAGLNLALLDLCPNASTETRATARLRRSWLSHRCYLRSPLHQQIILQRRATLHFLLGSKAAARASFRASNTKRQQKVLRGHAPLDEGW